MKNPITGNELLTKKEVYSIVDGSDTKATVIEVDKIYYLTTNIVFWFVNFFLYRAMILAVGITSFRFTLNVAIMYCISMTARSPEQN